MSETEDTNPPAKRLTLAAATEAAGLIPGRRYWITFTLGVAGLLLVLLHVVGLVALPVAIIGGLLAAFSGIATFIGYLNRNRVGWGELLFEIGVSTVVDWILRLFVLFLYLAGRTIRRSK